MKNLLLLVSGVAVTCGCSLKKAVDNVDKTAKVTADVRDYSKELRDNSRALKDLSTQLGKRTDDLEHELTFKESAWMMEQNLRWLWGEEKLPETADSQPKDEPDLLFYAAVTIESMWFQFWKGDFREDHNALDERFALGAKVLFTRAMTHTPFGAEINVLNPDRSWKGVGALGARLDSMTDRYDFVSASLGLKDRTFYDVVMMALKVRNEVNPQTPFPKAVERVLQYAQVAEFMIQARHNFLPMMVLASTTGFKDLSTAGRALMAAATTPADLRRFTPAQLREWTGWLKNAVTTRAELRAMGIQPKYNYMIHRTLSKVDFGQADLLASGSPRPQTGIEKLRYDFAEAYSAVVDEGLRGE